MRRSLGWLTGVLVVCGACDPPRMVSERGDFALEVSGLAIPSQVLFEKDWPAPYLVLPGTRMCVDLRCRACPGDLECDGAALAVAGPMQHEGDGCYLATGPGEVQWSVGAPCGLEGEAPDRLRLRVVDPDEVEAEAAHGLDGFVLENAATEPAAITAVGAPWLGEVTWPLQVVAGSEVAFNVRLRDTGTGHLVAWETGTSEIGWTPTSGRPPIAYPDGGFGLVAFEGTEAEASLHVSDMTWPIGPVVGVAADVVTSLEVAGALYHDEDPDVPLLGRSTYPVFARAIARDADGAVVTGLPVVWSVDRGEIAVVPGEFGSPSSEQVWLEDTCLPPEERGGPREVVLRATHGDLSATLTLRWTGTASARDPEWTRSPYCLAPEGCGCRASDPSAAALLVLGLLALRRRRKQDVSTAMVFGACLLALPLTGCDEDDPPLLRAAGVHELGSLPLDWFDRGGSSLRLGERGLWLLDDGEVSVFATTPDLDARDGLYPFEIGVDDEGIPRELLPRTADEAAYDATHVYCDDRPCPQVDLRPGPIVHDPERDRLLIFYAKKVRRESDGEAEHVGTSIAVWRADLAGRPVRPRVAEGAAEPTLLFGADEPRLAAAALAEGEYLYAFTCDGKRNPCILARAPLSSALWRDSWSFYGEEGVWSASAAQAQAQFDGAPALSVHHSAHADAYVAAYAVPGAARIVVRTAARLEGPWSDAREIHRAWQPVPAATIERAMIHPELAQEGDRVDYLTYHADRGGLQLVEIRWE